MKRPCLGLPDHPCGRLTNGTRCPDCARVVEYQRTQAKRERRPRASYAETRRRAQAVAQWRATYGDWCPGWGREAHPSTDLTADHVAPFALTRSEAGAIAVLCRSCNGRKQARGVSR